ncbi:MAG TPA: TonB family protein [Longimicrobium sp.]|nr:TonB family protein [Longimicrobium sp.]
MTGLEELAPGSVLAGHYLVKKVIARGGTAAVYSALDQRLDHAVALKVIRVPGDGAAEQERWRQGFVRGAEAAVRLRHPHVVTVHDFGADEALGLAYVVMELLKGVDLASRTARPGRLSAAAALAVVSQAARGLAAGHRAGMVHGDVKPANLFLALDGHDRVQVRVLDFGIAQAAFAGPALATAAPGPPSSPFAAPELRGGMPATAAADVFSLAAVAVLLLTGQSPFTGEATMQSVETDAALGRLVGIPGVTPAMRDVLRRALATEPHRRWPDADAFREALQTARGTGEDALTPASFAPVPSSSAAHAGDERVPSTAPADGHALRASAAYEPTAPPPRRRPAASPGARPSRPGFSPPPPPRKAFGERARPAVILLLVAAGAALTLLWPWQAHVPGEPAAPAESATRDALPELEMGDSLEGWSDSPGDAALASATPEAESGPGTPQTPAAAPPDDSVSQAVEVMPQPLNLPEVMNWVWRNHPPELRGVRGNLRLRFAVGADGRVESGSVEVLTRSAPQFERVAIQAAERLRYSPARVGGRPVRVWVELPFLFWP